VGLWQKLASAVRGERFPREKPFLGSEQFWAERYDSGGNSGDGSYGVLAAFKAEILNQFVADQGILSIIEFGCGDGNQLKLSAYPSYRGFDVSPKAVDLCEALFVEDSNKSFSLLDHYEGEKAELSLSLDVLYHLIEDAVFENYMNRLFDSAQRFVIIYASNTDENPSDRPKHVKHRKFSNWVEAEKPIWSLREHIPNAHPFDGNNKTGSFADFYIYERS